MARRTVAWVAAFLALAAWTAAPAARAEVGPLDASGSWNVGGAEDPSATPLGGSLAFAKTETAGAYTVSGVITWGPLVRYMATGTAKVVARTASLTLNLIAEPGQTIPGANGAAIGATNGANTPPVAGAGDALNAVGNSVATGGAAPTPPGPTPDGTTAATTPSTANPVAAAAAVAAAAPATLKVKLTLIKDGRLRVLSGRWRTAGRTGILRLSRSHREKFADYVKANYDKLDFTQYGYARADGTIEVDCADAFLILVSTYANENNLDLLMVSGTPTKSFRLSDYKRRYGTKGINKFTAQVCAWFGTFNLPDFADNMGGEWRQAQVGDVLFKPASYSNGYAAMGHTTLMVGYWTDEELKTEVPTGSSYRQDLEDGIASGAMKPYLRFKIFASTVGWSAPRIKEIDARNRYIGNADPEMNYLKQIRRVRDSLFSERAAGTP